MADLETSLNECMTIGGAVGVALVDYTSGMTLGSAGGGPELDLEVAEAGNTEVVRVKMRTVSDLGLDDTTDDILITLSTQTSLIERISQVPVVGTEVATSGHEAEV